MPANPLRPVILRAGVFKADWILYSPYGVPAAEVMGPVGLINRKIVRSAYPLTKLNYAVSSEASIHEHWLGATVRWHRRNLYCSRSTTDPNVHRLLTRMLRCAPAGYTPRNPDNRVIHTCNFRLCLYCHARAASWRYQRLFKAYGRRPRYASVWMSQIHASGIRSIPNATVQRLRPAAAVSFSRPPYQLPPEVTLRKSPDWKHSLVLISDVEARLKHPKFGGTPHPLCGSGRMGLAGVCASAWSYPRGWANAPPAEWLRLIEQHSTPPYLSGPTQWASFGACRDPYRPGLSVVDFVGHPYPGRPPTPA